HGRRRDRDEAMEGAADDVEQRRARERGVELGPERIDEDAPLAAALAEGLRARARAAAAAIPDGDVDAVTGIERAIGDGHGDGLVRRDPRATDEMGIGVDRHQGSRTTARILTRDILCLRLPVELARVPLMGSTLPGRSPMAFLIAWVSSPQRRSIVRVCARAV